MCDQVEEFMADGYSLTAFAGKIGVNRDTLHNWGNEHPEFFEAVTRGKAKQLLWWESAARKIADGKGGPGASTITIFGMKNCGGGEWKETREYRHSGPNGDPVKITSNMSAQEAVEEYQKMLRDERTIVLFPSNSDSKDDECE
jgi:hypothetical protein